MVFEGLLIQAGRRIGRITMRTITHRRMAESTQMKNEAAKRLEGRQGLRFFLGLWIGVWGMNLGAWADISVGEIRARGMVYTAEDFAEEEEKPVVEEGEKKPWRPLSLFEKKKDVERLGYLVATAPLAIRFSDEELENQRAPMPALPEYSILSNRYEPYLIEEPLPEDELRKNKYMEQLVINLEPHTVVSGAIDFESGRDDNISQDVLLEENKTMVLRPEEVLIFFETDALGSGQSTPKALVPFSPATATPQMIQSTTKSKSSASYTIEE